MSKTTVLMLKCERPLRGELHERYLYTKQLLLIVLTYFFKVAAARVYQGNIKSHTLQGSPCGLIIVKAKKKG